MNLESWRLIIAYFFFADPNLERKFELEKAFENLSIWATDQDVKLFDKFLSNYEYEACSVIIAKLEIRKNGTF